MQKEETTQTTSNASKTDYGHIMLVDDDEDILNLFANYLKTKGYRVRPFLNPFKALEQMQVEPQNYSLLITDVRMPGISGVELVKRVCNNNKVKVILTSAFDLDGTDMKGITYDEFVKKPIHMESLIESIDQVLNN